MNDKTPSPAHNPENDTPETEDILVTPNSVTDTTTQTRVGQSPVDLAVEPQPPIVLDRSVSEPSPDDLAMTAPLDDLGLSLDGLGAGVAPAPPQVVPPPVPPIGDGSVTSSIFAPDEREPPVLDLDTDDPQ